MSLVRFEKFQFFSMAIETHVFVAILTKFFFIIFGLFGQLSDFQFQIFSLFHKVDAPILIIIHCAIDDKTQQNGFCIFTGE